MTDRELERRANRRLAVLRHVEEVSGNVAATCRYYGISRQCYYGWLRRYEADGLDTSKIAFADSRISKADIEGAEEDAIECGGSIQVFPDAELAKGRAVYIQGVLKNSGLGAEDDYLRGPVLMRVTGNLSPNKAR
jgi:transposase-like protein